MSVQEKQHRVRLRRNQLQHIVLGTVAVTGLIGLAFVAPQSIVAMKKLGLLPSPRQGTVINTAIRRLLEKGLLIRERSHLRLTDAGRFQLLRATVALQAGRAKRWDGRWRVLIFDIPEYRKGLRQKVRHTLRAVGFVRLQDSVWAYPYDCEDFIVLLKADFRIGKDMLYMIVESLEDDARLRTHFKLPTHK